MLVGRIQSVFKPELYSVRQFVLVGCLRASGEHIWNLSSVPFTSNRLRACLKPMAARRVRAHGLQDSAKKPVACRPSAPTGQVSIHALGRIYAVGKRNPASTQRPSTAKPQPNCQATRFNAEATEVFAPGRRGNVFSADLRANHCVLGVKEIFADRDEVVGLFRKNGQ